MQKIKDAIKSVRDAQYEARRWFKYLYMYPKMSLEKTDYDHYWQSKRAKGMGGLSPWQRNRAELVYENIKDKKEEVSFLDIGGGDGNIIYYLKHNLGLNISKMYNADISQIALDKAKEFGFETFKGDIMDVNFVKTLPRADYILMFEILEHIQNSEEFLRAMSEKSNKAVFFSFPNTGFLIHRLRLLFGKFPLQWHTHPGEHMRYWTMQDLRWWLKSLEIENYKIMAYKGVPVLNKIYPALFGAGFLVKIGK